MPPLSLTQQLCIWALPLLFAITFHEAAHAFVASLRGDTTAKRLGRLTLNPIPHIDPFGTLILPLLLGILTQFTFLIGYAKPVPIHWGLLKKPRQDMILVALSGPFANLLMVLFWAFCFKAATLMRLSMPSLFLLLTAKAGILINLVLIFLNLIPIPPLDGSRVVSSMLPTRQALAYNKIEPYGFIILILLIMTGVLGRLFTPLLEGAFHLIQFIFKL